MIDLDAAKAARREAAGEAPTVTFGGREFDLPVELPFPVVLLLKELAAAQAEQDVGETAAVIAKIVEALLGGGYQAFLALGPSLDDLQVMLTGLMSAYGMSLGEASASESSSPTTSGPSKPPSKPLTASTSDG